jgi:hypothetical protein
VRRETAFHQRLALPFRLSPVGKRPHTSQSLIKCRFCFVPPEMPTESQLTYFEKLKDPRWQKLRLQVFERDLWTCQSCYNTENTLHCHHRYYEKDKEPWEYPLTAFETLCASCHESETGDRPDAEKELMQSLRKAGLSAFFVAELAFIFSYIPAGQRLDELLVTSLRLAILDNSLSKSLEKLTYIGDDFREQAIKDISEIVQSYFDRKFSTSTESVSTTQ